MGMSRLMRQTHEISRLFRASRPLKKFSGLSCSDLCIRVYVKIFLSYLFHLAKSCNTNNDPICEDLDLNLQGYPYKPQIPSPFNNNPPPPPHDPLLLIMISFYLVSPPHLSSASAQRSHTTLDPLLLFLLPSFSTRFVPFATRSSGCICR